MDDALAQLVAAGPLPQRAGLRILLELAGRPRGRKLLALSSQVEQAALSLILLARYDNPAVSRSLGWDAAAVASRGRQLRRREGRP